MSVRMILAGTPAMSVILSKMVVGMLRPAWSVTFGRRGRGWSTFRTSQYSRDPKDPDAMGARYRELKQNESFEGVPLPTAKKWTVYKLFNVLEYYGPCYVRRGYRSTVTGNLEGGHAIVLIGANITDNQVCVLDPWFKKDEGGAGPNRWRQHHSIAEFNDFFNWNEYWMPGISLMYKRQPDPLAAKAYINQHQDLMWW